MGIILPAEGHLAVLQRNKALVGDGHAMGVARQVLQDLLGSSKGWFGIDHPFAPSDPVQPGDEVFLFRKELQLAMKA